VWPRGRQIGISITVRIYITIVRIYITVPGISITVLGSIYITVLGKARKASTLVKATCTDLGP
jgi:hypothetical protein